MNRDELLDRLKSITHWGDIDDDLYLEYVKHFYHLDDEQRRRIIPKPIDVSIGIYLKKRWDETYAALDYAGHSFEVSSPIGTIMRKRTHRIYELYDGIVSDELTKDQCFKMTCEILGIDNVITNPPQTDKRTSVENRRAELQKQVDDIPF